jgi:amidase
VIGPLARSVADLALVWPLLVGADGADPRVVPVPLPAKQPPELRGLRVAFHDDNSVYTPTDDVRAAVLASAEAIRAAGGALTETVPPGVQEAMTIGQGIARVGWGHDLIANTGYVEEADIDVDRLSVVMNHAILRAERLKGTDVQPGIELFFWLWKLDLYRSRMLAWMASFDAILCPVMGYAARPHGFSHKPDFSNLGYVGYTHPYSLLGWPSLVVRAGTSREGLPVGVQIVASPWREDVCLAIGAVVEEALGGWRPPLLSEL